MSTPTRILDGTGAAHEAKVTSENALKVTAVEPSGLDLTEAELSRFQYFNTYFLDAATLTSQNMNVLGTLAVPQTFVVRRRPKELLYITRVRFIFNDEQMDMSGGEGRRFASAAPPPGLTNGLRFFTDQSGLEVDAFNEPVKQMADFWRYADDFVSVTGALGAGEDFLSWDITFPRPVVITEGSIDRLAIVIRDDLTSINLFRTIATGYREVIKAP